MAVFFTIIIMIGSGIVLFSLFLMLAEKRRLHDYRVDLREKKEDLIKVIEDAELLIEEMNKFSDYVVTQIEDKHNTLTQTLKEADEKMELIKSMASEAERVEESNNREPAYNEESIDRILQEEEPELLNTRQASSRKGKVLTFDVKRREIIKLAKSGLSSTEIARILNCGKGEIELISKLGRANP